MYVQRLSPSFALNELENEEENIDNVEILETDWVKSPISVIAFSKRVLVYVTSEEERAVADDDDKAESYIRHE